MDRERATENGYDMRFFFSYSSFEFILFYFFLESSLSLVYIASKVECFIVN